MSIIHNVGTTNSGGGSGGTNGNIMNNNNNNMMMIRRPIGTTRVQIGGNTGRQERGYRQTTRSAFIPEEDDEKHFISKDESELLRNSILRLNRPRISRPWFEQPAKKDSPGVASIRSNSSSGCSSSPYSGPSSPVSSKCSSESVGDRQQSRRKGTTTTMMIGGGGEKGGTTTMALDLEEEEGGSSRLPQMLSASLVQKAFTNSTPHHHHHHHQSVVSSNAKHSPSSSSPTVIQAQVPSLKRKEFPACQKNSLPSQPPKMCQPQPNHHHHHQQQQWHPSSSLSSNLMIRRVNTAEEIEELSRAARKQMAILEELEVEDRDRKSRISSHLTTRGEGDEATTDGTSPAGSSRESTATRYSSSSSSPSSSSYSASSLAQRPACQSPPPVSNGAMAANNEWSTTQGEQQQQRQFDHRRHGGGLPQLLVEDIARRQQQQLNAIKAQNDGKPNPDGAIKVAGQQQQQSPASSGGRVPQLECKGCGRMITDVILQALGSSFHPACFRCCKCGKCLDGVPFAVEQNGAVICMDDYERHFVPHCHACKKSISAVNVKGRRGKGRGEQPKYTQELGQVVRVIIKEREYHVHCYCCEGCGMQLSNEEQSRCYPLGDHLLCRRCHTLWRRIGAMDSEAAVSDL